ESRSYSPMRQPVCCVAGRAVSSQFNKVASRVLERPAKCIGQPLLPGSLRLGARELDHLGPLLGFLGDEFSEVGGRDGNQRGAPPRYGTWTMSTPVIILNSSPDIWIVDPLPDDAMLTLPGLALA